MSSDSRRRVGAAAIGLALLLGGCAGADRYPSPDGRREVVITRDLASVDTVWTVSVRSGLLRSRDDLGCFTDDDPDGGTPTGTTWADDDTFMISTTTGELRVHLGSGAAPEVTQTGDDFLVPCPYS